MFFAILFCVGGNLNGQTLQLDIKNKKLSDFLKVEDSVKSEKVPLKSFYALRSGLAQPISFRRKENEIPDLMVYYFFNVSDSAIDHILYEWDASNFNEEDEIVKKSRIEIDQLIARYDQLSNDLIRIYGNNFESENRSSAERVDEEVYKRKKVWVKRKKEEVELYTVISNIHRKNGSITIRPTFRVRLYIYNI